MESKIDYYTLFDRLIVTSFYKKLRNLSFDNIEVNTIFTEFSFLLSEIKTGIRNEELIQKQIKIIFLTVDFSDEEKNQFQQVMLESGASDLYTVPSNEWISSTTYDRALNHIHSTIPPYPSWIVDPSVGYWEQGGRGWGPPLEYPPMTYEMTLSHNKCPLYIWDEDAYQADNTTGWIQNPNSDYWE